MQTRPVRIVVSLWQACINTRRVGRSSLPDVAGAASGIVDTAAAEIDEAFKVLVNIDRAGVSTDVGASAVTAGEMTSSGAASEPCSSSMILR